MTPPYAVHACHFSDLTSTPYPRPRDSMGASFSSKLNTPLKDWPKEWYQGANRRFASKYQQRATIALEFVNQ
jgi:hypothetical protein